MRYVDRDGKKYGGDSFQDRFLRSLYGSRTGRGVLKVLVCPGISKAGGWLLNTKLSRLLIDPFVKANGIDLSGCVKKEFLSYNDFFMRKLRSDCRPFKACEEILPAPCDSKLTVCEAQENETFQIKYTEYTLHSLLRDRKLAEKYAGGQVLIFRLSVEDYHRYCYVDDGIKTGNRKIPGILHTVNPAANEVFPIYKENAREYSILRSRHFGDVLMMEVGALMVGKIVNDHGKARVHRGQEKGHFEFGGSTVILIFERDKVEIDRDILYNSQRGYETKVRMGEKIGTAIKK